MKSPITSHLRRQGRVAIALTLGIAALMWLLGMWSGLPTVEARGPAVANPGDTGTALSSQSLITYFVYLPLLFHTDLVFSDDFSSTSSGWPDGEYEDENGRCEFEYSNNRYRVKVTDVTGGGAMRCIIPNFKIPKQVNGTFKLSARRTSHENPYMLYGFIFGASPDAFMDRWSLEVHPKKDPNCDNKPTYWLVAVVDGERKYFRDECTNDIIDDEDDWNDLMIIRNGSTIKVYINNEPETYTGASYLLNEGYFNLQVVSDGVVTVEFDNLEIRRTTTPP